MAELSRLKDELTADPLGRGYAAMTDQQAADSLNARNRSRVGPIRIAGLREWFSLNARAFKLRRAITDTILTKQQRSLAIIADGMLQTDDAVLDPGNPSHVALVTELVAAGVWSSTDKAALVAKATQSISRAAELGYSEVGVGWVKNARGL